MAGYASCLKQLLNLLGYSSSMLAASLQDHDDDLSGGCAVSRRSKVNTEVLIWGDNRQGYYDDNGGPYRHIDDVTRPTLRHLTSPPSTNSDAAFYRASFIIVIISLMTGVSYIQNAGYIRR